MKKDTQSLSVDTVMLLSAFVNSGVNQAHRAEVW